MVAMFQNPAEDLAGLIMTHTMTQDAKSPQFEAQKKQEFTQAFNQLDQKGKDHFLHFYGRFAPFVGQENQAQQMQESSFQERFGGPVQMPPEMGRREQPAYGVTKSTGIPGQGLQQLLGSIGSLRQPLQPGGMSGPSLMARLENVDNNVQQIARQLGVQSQPQRPNLPSAMQPMQGPPQGIMALLQQRQQQMMQADPMSLQQNQIAAQSRLQPTYMPQMQAQMPQAQMMQAMAQQAPQSAALRALQSQQAYRGLAAGPFAFSMRR